VQPTYYRLAPIVAARFIGLSLIVLAVAMFVITLVISIAGGGVTLVALFLVIGLALVAGTAWWLLKRAYVVRCTPEGYAVRLVRGAGVKQAAWSEVENATATTVRGIQLLDLHLTGGRTTHIPVALLAFDKEEFVRAMQGHLAAGQRVRPL
jgi:hypothetical protein